MAEAGSSLTLGTKLMVVPTFNALVEVTGAVEVTEVVSPPTAGVACTERVSLDSGISADRCVVIVESRPSFLAAEAAEAASVIEGVVIVVECKVTERLGIMDSAEVTVRVVGSSVGVVVLVMVAGKLLVGNLAAVASASSGIEGILFSSVSSGGVLAAATESVHTFVSSGVTVLEGEIIRLVETGTEFEIVTSEGVVVAVSTGAAEVDGDALGLNLVGVLVSPS